MPYIYSTMTCDNIFPVYAPNPDPKAMLHIVQRIMINGGHGMKNAKGLDTPQGVVTKVTDEELKLLLAMPAFRLQVADGFLVVDDKKIEPAKKAETMNPKDGSSPLTPKDFEKSEHSTEESTIYKKRSKPSL